ncbi:unnamed protein product [Onchocerca flexuosa]|uniref:Dentin sialophosphoprotein-like n=1 Tax=Onchocerca flexuosa TaxID=387005 RepID=A0A183H556_9BILA|nr:unnamed protein product [Onchocerca flexuosa]
MESKPIANCGEKLENEERQLSNEKQCGGDAHEIDPMGISADMSKVISAQGDDYDRTHKRLSKPVDLNEDKYTGDEESADSSDSEVKVSKKYRKKKFKGNMNTFNISSGTQSLLQIKDTDSAADRYSYSEKDRNHVEQSVPLTISEENKQVGKRLSVAERSLQQSLNYSGERNHSSSSSVDLSDRNSAGTIRPAYMACANYYYSV